MRSPLDPAGFFISHNSNFIKMNYKLYTNVYETLSDINTPVEVYLKIRDKYTNSILLESSEHKSKENNYSYICFSPIASFIVDSKNTTISYPDGTCIEHNTNEIQVKDKLQEFKNKFTSEDLGKGFVSNGLFGYTSYDAIPLFEEITFKQINNQLPLIQYHLYRFIIVFNHYNNELFVLEHLLAGEESTINSIVDLLKNRSIQTYSFQTEGPELSNFEDSQFLNAIKKGIHHCNIGDVFQLVLSRKFKTAYTGDEFNVYRALRSINPSPYLFYFDYGDLKLFGSSPEAQLTINHSKATINPIAGTYKRTGNASQDEALANKLLLDEKENAEHTMLVDLARNDLSKNCKQVTVDSLKKIEYYSHVIHLVSKVSGTIEQDTPAYQLLIDTYPAGTLSGAPKHKAMSLIDELEPDNRNLYGGAIGFIGFDDSFNHAIFIRSFICKNNVLSYQAGCGIVSKSQPELELEEVNNKLSALKKAIQLAKTI
jgi:anthranilate synthase component 1